MVIQPRQANEQPSIFDVLTGTVGKDRGPVHVVLPGVLTLADGGMELQQAIAAYSKARNLANEVTTFFCRAVGRPINTLEEFSLLTEWLDAIESAIRAAISIRDFASDKEFCAMQDECNMWLDHWQAS
ncbi:hypothetical protein [Cupriavidus basilensis]|uniref:Uncharacterized protein n=1 Tax=Cupriavidus basilensis TaxID=68895 RepID=A0A643G554_9BURK|nr:hypothetical protein [Cupriavidus basilensis]QOT75079.1 hypothetical protein F7R26_012585 [Cupriavidus basilensis]